MWIGSQVSPKFITALFGVGTLDELCVPAVSSAAAAAAAAAAASFISAAPLTPTTKLALQALSAADDH